MGEILIELLTVIWDYIEAHGGGLTIVMSVVTFFKLKLKIKGGALIASSLILGVLMSFFQEFRNLGYSLDPMNATLFLQTLLQGVSFGAVASGLYMVGREISGKPQ